MIAAHHVHATHFATQISKILSVDSAQLLTRYLFRNSFCCRTKTPIDQFRDEMIEFRKVERSTSKCSSFEFAFRDGAECSMAWSSPMTNMTQPPVGSNCGMNS
jgi:hypothetical protein